MKLVKTEIYEADYAYAVCVAGTLEDNTKVVLFRDTYQCRWEAFEIRKPDAATEDYLKAKDVPKEYASVVRKLKKLWVTQESS